MISISSNEEQVAKKYKRIVHFKHRNEKDSQGTDEDNKKLTKVTTIL